MCSWGFPQKISRSSRCFRVPPFVVPRWHENLSWASNARGHTRCVQRYVLGLHDESPQQKQCWHSSVKQKQIGGWFIRIYLNTQFNTLIIHLKWSFINSNKFWNKNLSKQTFDIWKTMASPHVAQFDSTLIKLRYTYVWKISKKSTEKPTFFFSKVA